MLPDQVLSTRAVPASFLAPRNRKKEPLEDWERGGVAIQDPTQGLQVYHWRGRYIDGAIVLDVPGVVEPVSVLEIADVTEFQFTFDQNMQPAIAYLTADGAFLYWFDTTLPGFTTLVLPAGSRSPRISLDDKRATQTTISDIVLAYIRGDKLYARAQRDRFLVEYELAEIPLAEYRELGQIGMNVGARFQFQLRGRTR